MLEMSNPIAEGRIEAHSSGEDLTLQVLLPSEMGSVLN
jgi:hypothetical protein